MGLSYTSYYGLARVSDMGPEVKGWAATDLNPQIVALLLKALTLHTHGGATPIRYPGYNYVDPATPISVRLAEQSDTVAGGVLSPGTFVGVRLAFLDSLGLETDASPETLVSLAAIPAPPEAPSVGQPFMITNNSGLRGGTYVYALTKVKGVGETQISPVTAVDVPFVTDPATSYNVQITFNAVSTFDPDEGVTQLNLYRATGLTSEFQLLKTFTDVNVAEYVDIGPLENSSQTPPTANTYDKNKYVQLDWSRLATPTTAQTLRVYVTQQPGVYGNNTLLAELPINDPATPLPSSYRYLGSETLQKGWPKDYTQLPDNPAKLRLNTEATGAPILTEYMDAAGFQQLNFVLPRGILHATPIGGSLYYDESVDQIRAYLADGATPVTLAQAGASFSHSATEAGGHNSTNIVHGSFTQDQVNNIIANSTGNQVRKQVQVPILATPSATAWSTTSTAGVPMPQMEVGFTSGLITPAYAGQWVEFKFSGQLILQAPVGTEASGVVQMEINGSSNAGLDTVRYIYAPANLKGAGPMEVTYATPISSPVKCRMLWWTTTGATFTLSGGRYSLRAMRLF